MNILQINISVNTGSTGRIAEDIGKVVLDKGHSSIIAASLTKQGSLSTLVKVGGQFNRYVHGAKTRLFDRHGFGSKKVTRKFIQQIDNYDVDLVQLHNIHGYYINIKYLFDYLKELNKPVFWTFHDCWPFTGHCAHFVGVNCYKWQSHCNKCPNLKGYPASWGVDHSFLNYSEKREIFTSLDRLHIITPSEWLAAHARNSFFKDFPIDVIHNGIDVSLFQAKSYKEEIKRKFNIGKEKILLGVANVWHKSKGLQDLIKLHKKIPDNYMMIIVGLSPAQLATLPKGIKGIGRTESLHELVELYSITDIYINPTYIDNFPTTNIEALACGTPVVAYNTGGCPEAVDEQTGIIVEKGDIDGLVKAIELVTTKGKKNYENACRERAVRHFSKDDRYRDYLHLYNEAIKR